MLHIVKTIEALVEASQVISESDQLLLVEQAVYAANPLHNAFPMTKGMSAFVLEADIAARGIANRISPSVTCVDFAGFVDLTAEQPNSITWE
ncbi:sulfur relay protein TusB [Vibrio galatheae]|uniref:Sulfur relay protein TusB n=1 Tax=Vibrio galatheae TaxID=579748 RepID=A0A0F4NEP8_9VIBR|nr:sulfurtransferase complex subunit TusB [Vibrio galatheae]KJY81587.1 sulfur relay protein TusB [Vibrio galatheae]